MPIKPIFKPELRYTIPDVSDAIDRPRLFSVLDANRGKPLFLIMGQAAQGKSTLVASFLEKAMHEHPCGHTLWLHLQKEDSDPANLFYLILTALNENHDQNTILPAMEFPQTTLGKARMTLRYRQILQAVFSSYSGPELNIVMDDMEALDTNAPCLELIQAMMEDLVDGRINPPSTNSEKKQGSGVRLFLLSRTLPKLLIQEFKIKKKIVVLTNHDLAFTLDETKRFFSKAMPKSSLALDDIKKIHAIADGWPGGLTLMVESLHQIPDISRLPDRLTSEAFDYFSEEIFAAQSVPVKDFLLTASLFDTLDPEILSKVTKVAPPLEMLMELERRNLFIHRLGREKGPPLFRLHKLFRTFLSAELRLTMDHEEFQNLCKEAGDAYDEKRIPEQAIQCYLKAGAWNKARQLIKKRGIDLIITGRFKDLFLWIKPLPRSIIWQDPWMIYFLTMTRRITGGKKNVEDFLIALSLFEEKNDIRGKLLCLAHLIEVSVFLQMPCPFIREWISKGEETLDSIKDMTLFSYGRAVLWQQIGFGYIAGIGDIPKGISACNNALIQGEIIDNGVLKLNATIVSTLGHVLTGEFRLAEASLARISTLTRESVHPEYRALKNLVAIDFALKKGEFTRANELLIASKIDIKKYGLIFLYPGFIEAKAMHCIYTNDFLQAKIDADHLADLSLLSGNDFYLGIAHRICGICYYRQNDLSGAEKSAQQALDILESNRHGELHLSMAKNLYGLVLLSQQEFSRAEIVLNEAMVHGTHIASPLHVAETSAALGLLMWETGQREKAAQYLMEAETMVSHYGYRHFLIMSPQMFARMLILALMFQKKAPSSHTSNLIATGLAPHATQTIDQLALEPITKKEMVKIRLLRSLTTPKIRVETFGKFMVFRSDDPEHDLQWEGTKPKLLLKAIICHGGSDIPKEFLIEDIWPESSETSGEKKFKVNLHRLRKILAPLNEKKITDSYIRLENGFISLDPLLVTTDADEFLKLSARGDGAQKEKALDQAISFYNGALELYKGDFMAEEPYAEWAVKTRESLKQRFMDILGFQTTLYLETGQSEKAMECLKCQIKADPLFEPAYQRLMNLYIDCKMKSRACRLFKALEVKIKAEIGAAPSPETFNIYARATGPNQ